MNLVISPINKRYSSARYPGGDIAAYTALNSGVGGDKRDSKVKQVSNCALSLVSGVQNRSPGFVTYSGTVDLEGCMKRVISNPCGLKNLNFEFSTSFKGVEGSSAKDCPLV